MPTHETLVETKSGKLLGTHEDGLYVFRGIPYAAPPVGNLRWMPPQPVKPWPGTRSAEKFGPICPQNMFRISAIPRQTTVEEPQSEDCLFLNVWTPGLTGKRPVMVWIHGGAFTNGSGSSPMHPGATLPKRGGVVLVSINYRLGVLGFTNLNKVTGGKIPASGNEGLLDQVAALRWVHDNIATFGGDPGNVTVFGESAGAMSIGCLLAMPKAKDLFKKAILQSGSNTARPVDEAAKTTEKFLDVLGRTANDTSALRALPVKALLDGQQALVASGARGATFPVVDGQILRARPLDAVKSGSAREVTVIAGGNLDEGSLFADPSISKLEFDGLPARIERMVPPKYVPGLIRQYREAVAKRGVQPTARDVYVAIQGDKMFRMPNVRLVEIQRDLGFQAFNYVFTWKCAVPGLGACHALDVGFVFGATNKEFHGAGVAVDHLAMQMQEAWTAFAHTGSPSCPSLGDWPPYGKKRQTMVFGEKSRVEDVPYELERSAWDAIPDDLLG